MSDQNRSAQGFENEIPEEEVNLAQYFFLFLRNWYWLVLGLALGFTVAYILLRYSIPVYQVSATALLNEKDQRNAALPMTLSGGLSPSNNIENDLLVLTSVNLMQRVVDSLDLGVSYFSKGRFINNEVYPPKGVRLAFAEPIEAAYGLEINLTLQNEQTFSVTKGENDTLLCRFGIPFSYRGVKIVLEAAPELKEGAGMILQIHDPQEVAKRYSSAIETQQSGQSDVVNIGLKNPAPEKAKAILETLVKEFNTLSVETKIESDRKTIQFIDERLQYITQELYDVEKEVEGYKRDKSLAFGIGGRATAYPSLLSNLEDEQLNDIFLQQALLDDVEKSLQDALSRNERLPVGTEILGKGGLSELIGTYNEWLLKRKEMGNNAKGGNPAVRLIDQQLEEAREAILIGIRSSRRELALKKQNLEQRLAPIEKEIRTIPTIERELLQIMRQQQIKEQLFLLLFQKREEAALAVAAKTGNSRLLNEPVNNGPVSPNKQKIYLTWVLLGLVIPSGIIFLREFLDQHIYSEKQIRRGTKAPFLGAIGQAMGDSPLVIKKGSRSSVAEMFRLVRTNLQFMSAGGNTQVYMVSSSFSGEGKSFVTINLGISISLTGRRVILLGLDMRKPKLSRYLMGKLSEKGVSNFMVDERASLENLIQPVPGFEQLYFLDCGPVPPNPAELIGSKRTYQLFEYLRKNFDIILADTAPLGLVSDAFLLNDHVDQAIIVTRFGVTHKNHLSLVEDIYQNKKLPKVGVLLNGVKAVKGHGNSYGYGYGYGYGYYEEDYQKKSWYKTIFNLAKRKRKRTKTKY
jgi:capsular exopolysaccharide synthesis family protein